MDLPASWNLTAINFPPVDNGLSDRRARVLARESFSPAFSYLRTRPSEDPAAFRLWDPGRHRPGQARTPLYGLNPPIRKPAAGHQRTLMAARDSSSASSSPSGRSMVEEIFYRHILIGKLSAYAPTWLVASFSAALFAYYACHPVAGLLHAPAAQHVLTLVQCTIRRT